MENPRHPEVGSQLSQCGVRLVLESNEYVRVSGKWQQQKMQLVSEMD